MTIPGFTAEASLYKANGHILTFCSDDDHATKNTITMQQTPYRPPGANFIQVLGNCTGHSGPFGNGHDTSISWMGRTQNCHPTMILSYAPFIRLDDNGTYEQGCSIC